MTTYVYKCDLCEHTEEIKQKMTDDPIDRCPKCNVMGLFKRVIQQGNFILKGTGWYKNG